MHISNLTLNCCCNILAWRRLVITNYKLYQKQIPHFSTAHMHLKSSAIRAADHKYVRSQGLTIPLHFGRMAFVWIHIKGNGERIIEIMHWPWRTGVFSAEERVKSFSLAVIASIESSLGALIALVQVIYTYKSHAGLTLIPALDNTDSLCYDDDHLEISLFWWIYWVLKVQSLFFSQKSGNGWDQHQIWIEMIFQCFHRNQHS